MCLSRQITSGFECETSDARFKLTDIGVTEQLLTKAIGNEYPNAQALVDAKTSFAEKSLFNTAVTYFRPQVFRNSVLDDRTVGDKSEGIKSAIDKYQGFVMELDCNNRGYEMDLGLQINGFSLQVDYTGTIEVKVYNLSDGVEVKSVEVDVVAGVVKQVPLDVLVKTQRRELKVLIGYDRELVPAYKWKMYNDCITCNKRKCGLYVYGYGAQWNEDYSGLERTGHMAGMSVDYSLICLYEKIICSNKELFGEAFLYKVGAELMVYAINSVRWNDTDLEKLQRMLAHFGDNFERLIHQAMSGIRLPSNDCYGCRSILGTKTVTP